MGQGYPGPTQQAISPPASYGGTAMGPNLGGYPGLQVPQGHAGGQQVEPPPTQVSGMVGV